ncbi:HEAT repeat-containing protein 3 isoform X2 [Hetaerina americana]|uniref:HEAT repeat-containing protein 3 isoform X2 n=1 Tax=Hetaerina americana TaxID=62018 RepID=UPI003A7F3484
MGKTKNRKYGKKNNPTGLPSVKSIELEESAGGSSPGQTPSKHEQIIQTVLDQLKTYGLDSKMCGLNTLASMTEDDSFVDSMLRHNLVRVVGPLLVDPNPPIREAAAVALRNISGMGMPEICDILVDEDVLTYVFALFEKFYSSNWIPSNGNGGSSAMEQEEACGTKKKSKRNKKYSKVAQKDDVLVNTFTQGVHLLWNLCKSSDLAVKIFNQQNIVSCLTPCLNPKVCGVDAAVAVAHCLQTLTENNEVTAHEISRTSEEVLLKILSPNFEGEIGESENTSKYLLLRVLVAGIVLNISKISPGMLPVLNMRLAVTIKDALGVNHRKSISVIHDLLSQENGSGHTSISPDDEEESNESMEVDDSLAILIEDAVSLVMAQTVAVELVTNLYYKEDEDDDWVGSESEDLPGDDMVYNDVALSCGVPEVDAILWDSGNIENILKKVEKDDVIWKKLETHPETTLLMSSVSTLRCRSLLCLQNVLPCVPDSDLRGFPGAFALWEKLVNLVCEEKTGDAALFEAATGAMRAMSERILKMDPKSFAGNIGKAKLQVLLDVEAQCSDSNTRVNIIRTVGIMGEALVHSSTEESCELIGLVGSFLLQVSTKAEEKLWVIAEALDALMDVFAEDSTDKAAVQIGLVNSLKTLLPSLRSKQWRQRKSLGHHAAVVSTANTNLERFIEYKVTHISHVSMEH